LIVERKTSLMQKKEEEKEKSSYAHEYTLSFIVNEQSSIE